MCSCYYYLPLLGPSLARGMKTSLQHLGPLRSGLPCHKIIDSRIWMHECNDRNCVSWSFDIIPGHLRKKSHYIMHYLVRSRVNRNGTIITTILRYNLMCIIQVSWCIPLRFVRIIGELRAGLEHRWYLTRLNQTVHNLPLPRQLRSQLCISFTANVLCMYVCMYGQ